MSHDNISIPKKDRKLSLYVSASDIRHKRSKIVTLTWYESQFYNWCNKLQHQPTFSVRKLEISAGITPLKCQLAKREKQLLSSRYTS